MTRSEPQDASSPIPRPSALQRTNVDHDSDKAHGSSRMGRARREMRSLADLLGCEASIGYHRGLGCEVCGMSGSSN